MHCHETKNFQDSSVTSSEEVFTTTVEKPSSDNRALVSRLESAVGKDENPQPQTTGTAEEEFLSKTFPWFSDFNNKCREEIGTTNINTLENLMTVFIQNVSNEVKRCYQKPNRAAKLKKIINDTLILFHMLYTDIKKPLEHSSYLDKMSDLMAMYLDMEIKASRRRTEPLSKITSKLSTCLYTFLDRSQNHILDSVLKTKYMNKHFWEVCIPIFSRVLRDSPGKSIYEMTYVRYILAFKMWKKVAQGAEERRRVMKLATVKLFPPFQFREKLKAGLLSGVLPKIPKSRTDITLFLMQAKFDVKEKTKAFLKAVTDPKQQGLLGSQLAADSDRPLFFGEDGDKSSNSDEQEDTTGSNVLMNDFWLSMSSEGRITDPLRLAGVAAKTKKLAKIKSHKNVVKCKGIATPVFKTGPLEIENNINIEKCKKKKRKLKDKTSENPGEETPLVESSSSVVESKSNFITSASELESGKERIPLLHIEEPVQSEKPENSASEIKDNLIAKVKHKIDDLLIAKVEDEMNDFFIAKVVKRKGIATPVFKTDPTEIESNINIEKCKKKKRKLKDKTSENSGEETPLVESSSSVVESKSNFITSASELESGKERLPLLHIEEPVRSEKLENSASEVKDNSIANIKVKPETDDVYIVDSVEQKEKDQVDSVCQGNKENELLEVAQEIEIGSKSVVADHPTKKPPCHQAAVSTVKVENPSSSAGWSDDVQGHVYGFSYNESSSVWTTDASLSVYNDIYYTPQNYSYQSKQYLLEYENFKLDDGASEIRQRNTFDMVGIDIRLNSGSEDLSLKSKENLDPVQGNTTEGDSPSGSVEWEKSLGWEPSGEDGKGSQREEPSGGFGGEAEATIAPLKKQESDQEFINVVVKGLQDQLRPSKVGEAVKPAAAPESQPSPKEKGVLKRAADFSITDDKKRITRQSSNKKDEPDPPVEGVSNTEPTDNTNFSNPDDKEKSKRNTSNKKVLNSGKPQPANLGYQICITRVTRQTSSRNFAPAPLKGRKRKKEKEVKGNLPVVSEARPKKEQSRPSSYCLGPSGWLGKYLFLGKRGSPKHLKVQFDQRKQEIILNV